ncbi:MAG TPA: adenosylcobinamide-GDP ribazoletransferase [Stellaceae bacterium]|nr:adenosylcobinamide-GDP ribazoletransferase [Stellaceae bacterium]
MADPPPHWSDAARWWGEFCRACAFLTRLPLAPPPEQAAAPLAEASWAFPLVGLVVGLVSGLAYALAARFHVPPLAAALIALGVGVWLTGGLHEDGLADTADGLGGGDEPEARLAIMRDSRIGAFGVLALIFSVGLRAAAIAAIGAGGGVIAALIAAHAVGRGFLPLMLRAQEPARSDGLGAEAGKPAPAVAWTAAGLAALIALVALDFLPGFTALVAAAAAMSARAVLAQRQLGGYTGDVLGAVEQSGETVVLLAAAAWAM